MIEILKQPETLHLAGIVVAACATCVVTFFLGRLSKKNKQVKTVTVTDVFEVKGNKSEKQIYNIAVMKLQNELREANAVKLSSEGDGKIRVTLTAVL